MKKIGNPCSSLFKSSVILKSHCVTHFCCSNYLSIEAWSKANPTRNALLQLKDLSSYSPVSGYYVAASFEPSSPGQTVFQIAKWLTLLYMSKMKGIPFTPNIWRAAEMPGQADGAQ